MGLLLFKYVLNWDVLKISSIFFLENVLNCKELYIFIVKDMGNRI